MAEDIVVFPWKDDGAFENAAGEKVGQADGTLEGANVSVGKLEGTLEEDGAVEEVGLLDGARLVVGRKLFVGGALASVVGLGVNVWVGLCD